MRKFDFAISMGSNVTSIYKADVGVVLSDKTALVTALKGRKEIATHVGNEAVSSGLEYKKVFSNGQLDFTLAELLLAEFFKKVEISKRDGIVFLVSLEDMKLSSEYRHLAYALGINNVEVIPSIIATAYGFEIENLKNSFLLCDIGSNTEIAIINNGRIVTGATVFNGGDNIDRRIAEKVYDEQLVNLGSTLSEYVKNELATLLPNDERTVVVHGFINNTTEQAQVQISSSEVFEIIVEEYGMIADAILDILSGCTSEVNADIRKHGIYLCGASSKIVGIEKFFKLKLGLDSYVYRPDTVTMVGAGQLLDTPLELDRIIRENVIR